MNISLFIAACLLAIAACNGETRTDNVVEENSSSEIHDSGQVVVPDPEHTEDESIIHEQREDISDPVKKDEGVDPASGTMLAGQYHMIVSFFSPGNGINREALEKFRRFLKENEETVHYDETRWGREGEIDFCIVYVGPAGVDPAPWNRKVRAVLEGYDRINFTENGECVHKR